MVAQDEGNKYILLALGKQLPKKWAAAEAREEARAAGGVDFNAESVLEESEDLDGTSPSSIRPLRPDHLPHPPLYPATSRIGGDCARDRAPYRLYKL